MMTKGKLHRLLAFVMVAVMCLSLPGITALKVLAEPVAEVSIQAADTVYTDSFEGTVIGKAVKGWSLYAVNIAGQYDPDSNWETNYSLQIATGGYDGTRAMSISAESGTRGYVAATSDFIAVSGKAGYALEYAMKIENAGVRENFFGGQFFVDEYDKDQKLIQRVRYGGEQRQNMDWTVMSTYLQTQENTAYIRLSYYLGGVWGNNANIQMLIDSIYVEKITDQTLVNGDFEIGESLDSVYSWHLSSKDIRNDPETNNWASNYRLARRALADGTYCATVTRKGIGYVTMDSNLIAAEGNTTYLLKYDLRLENVVYETCFGVRAYIAQYDKAGTLIENTMLHSEIRQEQDWKKMSYATVTHEDTKYIQVQFWCGGVTDCAFTACFDNVSLTKATRRLSDNGINNGGFEETLEGTLFDWETVKRNDTSWTPTANGYNGTNGVLCVKTGVDGHGYGVMKSNEFNVIPGMDYKLTYMARLENQVGNVYIVAQLIVYDNEGNVIDRLRSDEFDHRTKSDEWLQEVGYFTIPSGGVTAQIEFLTCGTSYKCWMDDVTWHLRDDNATTVGFDAIDRNGKIAGWTVSDPISVSADTKVFYNGQQSMHIQKTTKNASYTITSDIMIPVKLETRYQFNIYVKSQNSDIAGDGVRLNLITYDENGERLNIVKGIRSTLSHGEESNWRELVCGLPSSIDVAYVRPQITVSPGVMDFWLDGLKWKEYDGNPYIEEFQNVTSDGKPAGWESYITEGSPKFEADHNIVTITAQSGDKGYLSGMWKVAKEKVDHTATITYMTTGTTEGWFRIRYFDFAGKELSEHRLEQALPATNGAWQDIEIPFYQHSAMYLLLEVGNENAGSVSLDSIRITEGGRKQESEAVTTWRGQWIWYYEDHYQVTYDHRYFRTSFELDSAPVGGTLQITADDSVTLYINGVKLELDGYDDWESTSMVENLADYLVVGKNTLAIDVYNRSSAAALLFDGYVETENGTWINLVSNDTILANKEAVDGWTEVEFDDSKWTNCRIIGPVGTRPWSDIVFDASAYVSEKINVVDYSFTEELIAGNFVTFTMTVIPEEDITRHIDFSGSIWVRNTLNEVLQIELNQIDGPPTEQWKGGQEVTVSYTFSIPDYLPTAKYVMQISVNQIKITNTEIMNNKFTKAIRVTNETIDNETSCEFRDLNGTQTLYINGNPVPNMTYVIPDYTSFVNAQTDQYMHDAGVCVTRARTKITLDGVSNIWLGPDEYDFTEIDNRIYTALANHEDTYLLVQLFLDVPQWWKDANPDEMIVSSEENGKKNNVSFSSKKFADDAIAVNIAMIEHMKQQPYYNRIIGAVLSACQTEEWVWFNLGQYALDFSPATQTAFREYLKEIYADDAALQAAWNDPNVTLETAAVPPVEDREGKDYSSLLTPEHNRSTLDFHDFMADVNVKLLKRFTAEITEAVDDKWVLGAYYGYVTNTYFYGNSNGTMHIAVEQALEDENLDFMCAPILYNERYDGESGGYMKMIDSIQAHGKAVIIENDNRFCSYVDLSSNFYTRDAVGPTYNVWDSISQLERDFANQITTQVGQWYFNMWGTFFLNEQFSEAIGTAYNEAKVNMARPSNYRSDICYIIDEDMFTYLAYNSFDSNYEFLYPLLYEQRMELAKIGANYDMYYMSDLAKGLIPDYKIYMLMAPVEMDATEREAVEKYLKNNGKTVIWQYISGASDRNTFSAENMTNAIGMDVKFVTDTRVMQGKFGNANNVLIKGMENAYYGYNSGKKAVSPVAIVTDPNAIVLGTIADTGEAAFAIKDMGDWTSIYSAIPCIPATVLKNILEMNDVHIYCDDPDSVIFASDKYVGINCAYGGEKTIALPGNYSVYEVYTKTVVSTDTDTIVVDMADNSTRLFRLMTPGTHAVYTEAGIGGTVDIAGYQELTPSSKATYTFTADAGYALKSITVNGKVTEITGDAYSVTLENLDSSYFISAQFVKESAVQETSSEQQPSEGNAEGRDHGWLIWAIAGGSVALIAVVVAVVVVAAKKKKSNKNTEA